MYSQSDTDLREIPCNINYIFNKKEKEKRASLF